MKVLGENIVEAASFRVVRNPRILSCLGLGSCLGIALRDAEARIGGLGHPMLPSYSEGRNRERPERYVDSSIHLVLRARETHSASQVATSSTPQAVLLSSLTTANL